MAYEHILYEVSDRIATITLNRPDRMNAWTPVMVRDAMEASSADDNVRVIVLTGAGRASRASWRSGRRGLRGSRGDFVEEARRRPSAMARQPSL